MRKAVLAVLLLLLPASSLFAQVWRNHPYYPPVDNKLDITPFLGYRWGGTIYADQTSLYGQDVDLQSSANYGVSLGIPVAPNGMKIELMVDRQNTHVGNGYGDIFSPDANLGNFDVTYYHAGLMVPFSPSRTATPYFIVSAGVTNMDPNERGAATATKFSMGAGIGVNVPINPNLGIRAEFRGFYTPIGSSSGCYNCFYDYYRNDLTQGEAKVGLSFKF